MKMNFFRHKTCNTYSYLKKNKYLFFQLVKKDLSDKYRGSVLGWIWPVIVPLLMLLIYTFFFSVVFQARWGNTIDDKYDFALMMFCGLCAFNMFSEVLGRSTSLIVSNTNYVKKVIFPLDLLPIVITVSSMVNSAIAFSVLLVVKWFITRRFSIYIVEGIINFIPLFLLCAGVSYILSALSVYIKDLNSIISVITTIFMYISPIFYSIENIPEEFRGILYWNPITYIVENFRNVFLYDRCINVRFFLISCSVSGVLFYVGYIVFRRLKNGFADVL